MNVLIDIKMPDCCARCPCYSAEHGLCDAIKTLIDIYDPFNQRPDWCPLIPVPPHGRLIDADVLMKEFEKAQRMMEQHGKEYSCSFLSSSRDISTEWYCVEDMLDNAPTVIEADGVEA